MKATCSTRTIGNKGHQHDGAITQYTLRRVLVVTREAHTLSRGVGTRIHAHTVEKPLGVQKVKVELDSDRLRVRGPDQPAAVLTVGVVRVATAQLAFVGGEGRGSARALMAGAGQLVRGHETVAGDARVRGELHEEHRTRAGDWRGDAVARVLQEESGRRRVSVVDAHHIKAALGLEGGEEEHQLLRGRSATRLQQPRAGRVVLIGGSAADGAGGCGLALESIAWSVGRSAGKGVSGSAGGSGAGRGGEKHHVRQPRNEQTQDDG
mmetsp:Transcript_13030/g.33250  ORF Transcript_13030/g.33250 Transcript_13030/m.33250 type:complete len:265 (+) Transcript_13030:2221-3015(+)